MNRPCNVHFISSQKTASPPIHPSNAIDDIPIKPKDTQRSKLSDRNASPSTQNRPPLPRYVLQGTSVLS